MSWIGEWVRNDLRGMNKPSDVVRTVRAFPVILVRAALNFALGLIVIYTVLAISGHGAAFGDWWWLAVLWAGTSVGSMVSQHKVVGRGRSQE